MATEFHACMCLPSSMCALLVTATDVGVSDVTYRCDLDAILLLVIVELYNI